jgi:hypothetical protein
VYVFLCVRVCADKQIVSDLLQLFRSAANAVADCKPKAVSRAGAAAGAGSASAAAIASTSGSAPATASATSGPRVSPSQLAVQAAYVQYMQGVRVDSVVMCSAAAPAAGAASATALSHHYLTGPGVSAVRAIEGAGGAAGSAGGDGSGLKRVFGELRKMRSALPVDWSSTVLVRHDKLRPYLLKAVIFGPDDTPYDSGAFAVRHVWHRMLPASTPWSHGVCEFVVVPVVVRDRSSTSIVQRRTPRCRRW